MGSVDDIGHLLGFRLIRMISEPTTVFLGFLWFSHAFIVNQNGHGKQKWNHQSCLSPSLAFSSKTLQPFQTLTDLLKGISSGKPCKIGWRPCANFAANQASDLKEVSGFWWILWFAFIPCVQASGQTWKICVRARVKTSHLRCCVGKLLSKLGAAGPAHLVSVVKLSIVFWQISLAHVLFETHFITI